jgi:hypothetical protein
MATPYFSKVPNFNYVSRLPESTNNDFIQVKNLFKRGKLRDDIVENLNFFTKYKIIGDERPDNVAFKFYDDETLDWVVLLSNNILNVYSEWPLPQITFDKYLIEKYGTYDKIYDTHHYETTEVYNSLGVLILPAGLQVDQNYSITFYDYGLGQEVTKTNITVEITNYQYEEDKENKKRNIYILKPVYLNVILNDIEEIMSYKQGSIQYVDRTLKKGDNIKLYE